MKVLHTCVQYKSYSRLLFKKQLKTPTLVYNMFQKIIFYKKFIYVFSVLENYFLKQFPNRAYI